MLNNNKNIDLQSSAYIINATKDFCSKQDKNWKTKIKQDIPVSVMLYIEYYKLSSFWLSINTDFNDLINYSNSDELKQKHEL